MSRRSVVRYRIQEAKSGGALWKRAIGRFCREAGWAVNEDRPGAYHFLLALDQVTGRFLGGCVIHVGTMMFGPLAEETVGYLENVSVLKTYRRIGIGTALLRRALRLAWRHGAQHVRWSVDYANREAIAFYVSLGLALCPEEDPCAENPEMRYLVVATDPGRCRY